MKISAAVAGLFIGALALSGCASTSPTDAFVSTVRESVPEFADATSADIADLGKQVCGLIEDADGDEGLAIFISKAKETGLDAGEAGAVAGAAVAAYCPEFSGLFE